MKQYNIAKLLFEMAATQLEQLAIALPAAPGKPLPAEGNEIPYRQISFQELTTEVKQLSQALLDYGFEAGDRVVLMVPPSLEFFTLSFAFLQCGIIPVLIDPGIGIKNLKKCIAETQPNGFIGITKAQIARLLLGWGRGTIRKKLTIGPRLFWGGGRLRNIKAASKGKTLETCFAAKADDLCGILFTSGSTGVPKGVRSTYGIMYHQVQIIRDTYDMKPGEIDLPTFPPFALFNPVVGLSTIIPDMDPTRPAFVDPERLIRTLRQFKVTSMFGSPALIDRVGRYAATNEVKLPNLQRVLSAGAPVPARTMQRFSTMLNAKTQIYTPYGATESLPIASIGSHELLQEEIQEKTRTGGGICIGMPVEGVQAEIIAINDEPIADWTDGLKLASGIIGEIVVKGENVTQAYYNRDAATRLAKIKDHDRYWHRMGDLGYKDQSGRLWFCGRKAHRVRLLDKDLYTVQCESIFNAHPQVYRTALVGVKKQAILCVEIDKEVGKVNQSQLKAELLQWAVANELTKEIKNVLFHPSFPVDIRHNAKIFREKLAVWATKELR